MYRCQNRSCGHLLAEDETASYEEHTRSEFWGTVAPTTETFLCCPFCGHDIAEVLMCSNCKKEPAVIDDFCKGCDADANEALEEFQRSAA